MEALSKILRNSLLAVLLFTLLQVQAQEEQHLVSFTIKNAGINVDGFFSEAIARVQFDPANLRNASLAATIEVSSIDTGIKARDKHLKKEKYFDLDNYPQITFQSTRVSKQEKGYLLKGNLTIKETTLPIEIPFTIERVAEGSIFKGSFTLDRRDYGVGKNHLILSDEVTVEIYYVLQGA
jgi:polyisoprenoid-binding protein YceI